MACEWDGGGDMRGPSWPIVLEGRILQPAAGTSWFLQALLEDSVGRYRAPLIAVNFPRDLCWEDPFPMVTVTLALVT